MLNAKGLYLSCIKSFLTFLLFLLVFSPSFLLSAFSYTDLSTEEKVSQLFVMHLHGEEPTEEMREKFRTIPLGGVIYYRWANGLKSFSQVQNLSFGLKEMAVEEGKVPPLILVDQEGGRVARLQEGFPKLPPAKDQGKRGAAFFVASWQEMAKAMHQAGIDVNLAPVVDLPSESSSPKMRDRMLGTRAKELTILAEKMIHTLHREHVGSCLKHFPGLGSANQDPHDLLARVEKSENTLLKEDLLPFIRLSKEADMVMSSHLMCPTWDRLNMATTSKPMIQGLLRERLQFSGVIVTDSLLMKGGLDHAKSLEELALQAFLAGHDMLLFGGAFLQEKKPQKEVLFEDLLRTKEYFLEAVQKGVITKDRLDSSVKRILALKEKIFSSSYHREAL